MSACCAAASDRKTPTWVRRVREIVAWVLPSAILVLAPKCPACLVAYIAIATGIGVSFSAAAQLQFAIAAICAISLTYTATRTLLRLAHR